MKYSSTEQIKIDFRKTPKISEVSLPIRKIINNTPYPYIGHIGPIKNPRLTNLFYSIDLHTTSINQPINE